jgi:hypothetical protein
MTPAEIEGKFRRAANKRLTPAKTVAVLQAIKRLEALASIRSLLELLANPSRA